MLAEYSSCSTEKIQALSLAKECYYMKLDLLTKATVVDDAIRFVSSDRSNEKVKPISSNNSNEDGKESNEPDYNKDKDQLEEKREEEQQTNKMTTTINAVF